MIEVSKTITTTASPSGVLDWFAHFDEHYVEWWPEAHKEYEYTSETPPKEGTTFRFVQMIKGRRAAYEGVITKMEPAGFEWRAKGAPMGGSYRYRPLEDGGTEITQTIRYGSGLPFLGLVVDLIADTFIMPRRDLEAHLDEEMARLKTILEAEE